MGNAKKTLTRFLDLMVVPATIMLAIGILLGATGFGLSDGGPMGIQLFQLRWWLVLEGCVGAMILAMCLLAIRKVDRRKGYW